MVALTEDWSEIIRRIVEGDDVACEYLTSNFKKHPGLENEFANSNVIPKLVSRLEAVSGKDDKDSLKEKQTVLRALTQFSLPDIPSVLGYLCCKLDIFIALLSGPSSVALEAVHFLEALSTHNLTSHIMKQNILEPLNKLMVLGSDELLFHSVVLLGNLADGNRNRFMLCDGRMVRALTRVVMSGSANPASKEQAVTATRRIASFRPQDMELLAEASFPQILTYLAALPAPLCMQLEGVWSIHLLSGQTELRSRLVQVPGLIPAMTKAASACSDDEGRDVAGATLDVLQPQSAEQTLLRGLSSAVGTGDEWIKQGAQAEVQARTAAEQLLQQETQERRC